MNEKFYMQRCITLAQRGLGKTYPNPMVGAVIVHHNTIIGEGWHQQAGGPHAEVHAIRSVKKTSLLKESTIYVSLEPCSHYGKTPPCADLIIKHQIPKVVIGIQDLFAKVNGAGIQKLKEAGCDVSFSGLEQNCFNLNKRFFTFHQKKRPYIILKWAETKDGFIDRINLKESPHINWISNSYSKQLVHKWRTEEQGILIGKNTALSDNPQLNVRSWTGKHPIRIVIDRYLEIPKDYNLHDSSQKTIIINQIQTEQINSIHFIQADFNRLPQEICSILYQQNIQSVIIEGGRYTIQSFIDVHLWDEARVFTGDHYFKQGIKAPLLKNQKLFIQKQLNNDLVSFFEHNT